MHSRLFCCQKVANKIIDEALIYLILTSYILNPVVLQLLMFIFFIYRTYCIFIMSHSSPVVLFVFPFTISSVFYLWLRIEGVVHVLQIAKMIEEKPVILGYLYKPNITCPQQNKYPSACTILQRPKCGQ